MRFVADENVDLPIITRLRKDGHEVQAVIEMSSGISDDEVLKQANRQGLFCSPAIKILANWSTVIRDTLAASS